MKYFEYITSSLAKGTLGGNISVAIMALIGVCAALGIHDGMSRGFSKSVIRFFTVGASAVCALFTVTTVCGTIVKTAVGVEGEIATVYDLIGKYFPGYIDAVPELFKPILQEIGTETATIFVMMLVAILLTPVLFIVSFYLIRFLSLFVYQLLAGLTGAISFGKGVVSTVLGGVVGLAQGLLIAAVIIIPISGLCDIAVAAREPLIEERENPNAYVVSAYEIVDDVADNPVFELVEKFGGKAVYDSMITVKINDTDYNMGEECVDAIKVITDLLPLIDPNFDWQHPSDEQKEALTTMVVDIANDDLLASLISDVMRGVATCIREDILDMGLEGPSKTLLNDAMYMFVTCNRDTIEGDLKLLVDIYFIMCDRNLISAFASGNAEDIRTVLTEKDANGVTAVELILDKLNSHDRASVIITSFTKLSISTIMGSAGLGEEAEQLYEDVKEDIITVLNHNKSDFETEEEYKQAVYDDLDKALTDNNIEIEEEIKQSMVDYIADNYGDHEGEITEKEINDAILSYYKSYADNKEAIDGILGGDGSDEDKKDQIEDILGGLDKDEEGNPDLDDILGGLDKDEEGNPDLDDILGNLGGEDLPNP